MSYKVIKFDLLFRMSIQFQIRRYRHDKRDASIESIQSARTVLLPLFTVLSQHEKQVGIVAIPLEKRRSNTTVTADNAAIADWDNLECTSDIQSIDNPNTDDISIPQAKDINFIPFIQAQRSRRGGKNATPVANMDTIDPDIPPEHVELKLPSYFNVSSSYNEDELRMRRKHAHHYLIKIRELIAEKSFHYTDHIRTAPRKGVRTRGRSAIVELNHRLSFLCQMYSWTRQRIIDLGATEDNALGVYKELTKANIRCSTAILQPNQQGSTKIMLSWIWQSVNRRILSGIELPNHMQDERNVFECKSYIAAVYISYTA